MVRVILQRWGWARRLAFALLTFLTCATSAYAAAPIEALPAQRFRPAIGDGILDIYTGDVPAPFQLRSGVWVNYASRPVVLAGGGGALVRHRLDVDAVLAVVPFARVMFGFGIRATPFQDRDARLVSIYGRPQGGLGDLRFMNKLGIVQGAFGQRFDLALVSTMTVAATSQGHLLTDAGFTVSPEVAMSMKLSPVTVAMNLGFIFRPALRTGTFLVEHEVTYRLGARLVGKAIGLPLDFDVALSGSTALRSPFGQRAVIPLEAGGAVRLPLRNDTLAITVAGFAGLVGGYNEPQFRLLAGLSFAHDFGSTAASSSDAPTSAPASLHAQQPCPEVIAEAASAPASIPATLPTKPPRAKPVKPAAAPDDPLADSDGDGIPNARDGAPYLAEDIDGYHDDDGVPELGPE